MVNKTHLVDTLLSLNQNIITVFSPEHGFRGTGDAGAKIENEIDIKTGNVGGPSAGLMMALNVYNNLIPNDITNSLIIAGTGTIEIDGSVGPVGGIRQKVIAAKRAGSELILVPTANYEEASPLSTDDTAIVAVDSFEEALKVISEYSSR